MNGTNGEVKTYFITIPAHKFLHIRNYESIGYWDFWQKQSLIPGQDCDTICGLLDSIKGKLDDVGGTEHDSGSGQILAYINDHAGRICSWGIPLIECYGVRLPLDYDGEIPSQMTYSYELEGTSIEDKLDAVARKVYHADGVDFVENAPAQLKVLKEQGFGDLPVCVAKTQYSFSDNPALLGAPRDFRISVRNLTVSAGAGFIVALTGDIMTMPGLSKVPSAEKIDVDSDGKITGLF